MGKDTETVTAVVERGTNGTASIFNVRLVGLAGSLLVWGRTTGMTAGGWGGGGEVSLSRRIVLRGGAKSSDSPSEMTTVSNDLFLDVDSRIRRS